MANSKPAYPSIELVCEDRVRVFCLNLGAFRAMEEYQVRKTGREDFNILEDFDWGSGSIENVSLMIWAGLFTDAKKHDKEVFTIEKAEAIVSIIGIAQAKICIDESLQRAMTPQQYEKMKDEVEKKTKARKEAKNLKKKKLK